MDFVLAVINPLLLFNGKYILNGLLHIPAGSSHALSRDGTMGEIGVLLFATWHQVQREFGGIHLPRTVPCPGGSVFEQFTKINRQTFFAIEFDVPKSS